jgi:hypothetical protein
MVALAGWWRPPIGVAFLARGRHDEWRDAFQRFIASYERCPVGIRHRLYVIFKGFVDDGHLRAGEDLFAHLRHVPIHLDDDGFDIGAYKKAAERMREEFVCFLNTKSEILVDGWLRKLAARLAEPGVGLVGNTGSFESHHPLYPVFPEFPNVHIRTNGFLLRRDLFRAVAAGFDIRSKYDAWMFESGPDSLSRQIVRQGLKIAVVGRDGEAYEPSRWPMSRTYRSTNDNVLIADDDYRSFPKAEATARETLVRNVWGP